MIGNTYRDRIDDIHALMTARRNQEAITLLQSLDSRPEDAYTINSNIALCYVRDGDYGSAVPFLREAVRIGGQFKDQFLYAQALLFSKKLPEAKEEFDKCLEMGEDDARTRTWLARTLLDMGNLEEARRVIHDSARSLGWDLPGDKDIPFRHYPYFLQWIPNWLTLVDEGSCDAVLEVGSMEGLSSLWMADKLLAKNGKMYCNDIQFRGVFHENVEASGLRDRLALIEGSSEYALDGVKDEFFDFVYIDGDHRPGAAFQDGVNGLRTAKIGGLVVFDDYLNRNNDTQSAVDYMIRVFKDCCEIVDSGRQVTIRKTASCSIDTNEMREAERRITIDGKTIDLGAMDGAAVIDLFARRGREAFVEIQRVGG